MVTNPLDRINLRFVGAAPEFQEQRVPVTQLRHELTELLDVEFTVPRGGAFLHFNNQEVLVVPRL